MGVTGKVAVRSIGVAVETVASRTWAPQPVLTMARMMNAMVETFMDTGRIVIENKNPLVVLECCF